ncbi:SDR family oxidoreductase [Marinobacter psychrophilus]|jgi:NADP-dependent 3-hydroxy acid dehydrogenase YdfG|uniref:SDR family oxidoreductase n=1 Tax=Marinobacter psychrophilus TaxID=330734 RepID=UPI001B6DF9F0|nr:SDR family oxidoreductase [Marinobacter psychrophilus]MBQ0763269.1 SDR family oxidoreductase [Marinobacter psychrophilus]MBQ0844337.1 SDR family oxidoreductase [Marinobacter psychrophilus]
MSNTNDPINGKIVIITGASSGLGESTARHLADRGAKLVLAARREDRLKSLTEELEAKGAEVFWQVTDVTDRKQVESLAAAAKNKFGRIDVLINNAGLMPLAPLDALKVDEWEQMIDVNIKGVLYGIAAVLPTMREQHSGHVINLSSVAGHKVFPGGAVYCATKYAVRALSEGLRMEAGDEIRSTNISPGAIATELTSTITDPDAAKAAEELYKVAINADSVARAIVFAIEQPHDVDINEIILRPTAQEL